MQIHIWYVNTRRVCSIRVQRPSKGWVVFERFRIRSVPDIHFPQCPQLKESHLINHLDGASPNQLMNRDQTHIEKPTYTCNMYWTDRP